VKVHSAGDEVFRTGFEAEHVFFIIIGKLEYGQDPSSGFVDEVTTTRVDKERWISDAALWTMWSHVGDLRALANCEVMSMNAQSCIKAIQQYELSAAFSTAYAKQFLSQVQQASPPEAKFPSDLGVPHTDFGDIVLSMPKEYRKVVGHTVLDSFTAQQPLKPWRTWGVDSNRLKGEVECGDCTLVLNRKGELEKIGVVVLLSLEYEGRILAQLGKCPDGQLLSQCRLPGLVMNPGELHQEAIDRLIHGKLQPFVQQVHLGHTETVVDVGKSKFTRVNTRKTKIIQYAVRSSESPPVSLEPQHLRAATSETLPEDDVYSYSHDGVDYLFAWLTRMDFEKYRTEAGDKELERWLKSLGLGRGMTQNFEDLCAP